MGLALSLLLMAPQIAAQTLITLGPFHALGQTFPIPVGDPFLAESLHYH